MREIIPYVQRAAAVPQMRVHPLKVGGNHARPRHDRAWSRVASFQVAFLGGMGKRSEAQVLLAPARVAPNERPCRIATAPDRAQSVGMSSNQNRPNSPSDRGETVSSSWSQAVWYDRSINWDARFSRELPVLCDVFGPPAGGGLIDAGCGTGRHATALAERGYTVVGADASEEMLALANEWSTGRDRLRFAHASYSELSNVVGSGYDGLYCLGNSLAAAGSKEGVIAAVEQFAACLRPGGRLFVQILNFAPMRSESPCVRGPRVTTVDGLEYVSFRQFHFDATGADITNVTFYRDKSWHKRVGGGRLYTIGRDEFVDTCIRAGFTIDELWGDYQRNDFDIEASSDLILVGARNADSF